MIICRPTLICTLAIAAGLSALAAPAAAQTVEPRTVTVQGRASAEVEPDMATVSVGVTARAREATAALDAASTAAGRVIDHAGRFGIAAGDIRTGSVSLTEAFKNRPDPQGRPQQEPDGYVAANVVVIRIRELARMGAFLREAAGEGANRINGVTFGLLDPETVKDEMRAKAVEDGRRKAGLLAGAAGAKLGEVRTIVDAHGYQPFEAAADISLRRSAAPSVPIEAGRLTVTAEITITWTLE